MSKYLYCVLISYWETLGKRHGYLSRMKMAHQVRLASSPAVQVETCWNRVELYPEVYRPTKEPIRAALETVRYAPG